MLLKEGGTKDFNLPGQYITSNKAKGKISKQCTQEKLAREIFKKTNISHPLIRIRMCVYW